MPKKNILKTGFRGLLGTNVYRFITQFFRVLRFIIHPKYDNDVGSLAHIIKPDMVCFDIGAHYGHYARVLSPLVGTNGKIFSFEPSRITFSCLRLAKAVLRWKNVHVENCALSNKAGEQILHIPIKNHGGLGTATAHLGHSADRKTISEKIRVETLDEFVRHRGILRCDFIKCDVEGAELLVLRGGNNTIEKFRPALLLEINDGMKRHGHMVSDIEEFLSSFGYSFYVWRNSNFIPISHLNIDENNFAFYDK